MSRTQVVSITLFVLGLILVGVSIDLFNVSQTTITLAGLRTTYPYLSDAAVVIIMGMIVLVVAYLMILLRRT
jgi:hypothetical protein